MVRIPRVLWKEILYFLNDWLRLMGYGGEHRKLSMLIWNLYKARVIERDEITSHYYIHSVIKEFERFERIENENRG